jgi:hypothetical protein
MSDLRWSPRNNTSPGRVRLNDANLLMLRHIVHRALPGPQADAFDARVADLHRAVAGDGGDALDAARALKATLDGVVRQLASRTFQPADLRAMLAGLVKDGLDGRYRDYAGAEQATMAIGSLLDYLAKTGALRDVRAANRALDALHAAVVNDEAYKPARFRESLLQLQRAVTPGVQ